MKLGPSFPPCTKLISKYIRDLNVRLDALNLIQEKIRNTLELMGTGKNFLNRSQERKARF